MARRERDLPGSAPGPVTDPAPILTRYLLNVMKGLAGWSLVPKKDVQEAMVVWGSAQADSRANKVGARVNADAVLYGRIFRYQERVGAAGWGAKSPASVAFALYLMDVRGETIVWQARFQETQRPLSENIFALGEFVLRGAKWLTAEELALAGIKKAVQRLQQALYPRGVNSIYPFDGNGSIPAGESVSKGRSSSP